MTLFEYAKGAVWLAGLATGACALTHSVVRADFSAKFGKALASYNLTVAVRRWPSHFVELFDSVFGSKHWSWFCFERSCFCSLGGLGAVIFTYFVLSGTSFFYFVIESLDLKDVGFLGAFNLFPDFFSLLETRWLIGQLGRNPSLKKLVGVLLLDLTLTPTIFIVFASMYYIIGSVFAQLAGIPSVVGLTSLFDIWTHVIMTPLGGVATVVQLTFYTTFLTSVWVWMLAGSILATKLLGSFGGPLWRWVSRSFLDMETKPFLSLGWIAGASVLFGALVCLPVLLLTGKIQ